MEVRLTSHYNRFWILQRHTQMNDMNDWPGWDLNLRPLAYKVNDPPLIPLNYLGGQIETEENNGRVKDSQKTYNTPTGMYELGDIGFW